MESINVIPVLKHTIGNNLGIRSGPAEDKPVDTGIEINQTLQGVIPVFCMNQIVVMFDCIGTGILLTHGNFRRVVHIF